ncbi:MAG TPA: AsmA-like C-terminal region-containing protein [Candidatus Sulfotelmatobacter sp.]|jgi:hypothetical protein
MIVLIGAAAALLRHYWPFDQKPVIEDLEEDSDSHVQVRAFHRTYFPHPGCILDGVVFRRGSTSTPPLIVIEKLTIEGSYAGIFASRVSRVTAEGMHVVIPPFGTAPPFHAQRSTTAVGEIIANGATLEFASAQPNGHSLRFDIHQASLRDVGENGPLTYDLKVHNPEPPGEVTAFGKFGMWNDNDPAQTPISGEYKFEHADLSVYHSIGGILSSTGKFSGKLQHIDISGTTDTPDFTVESGHHPVRLKTEFSAYVDATHGDTFLNRVDAHFRKTHVVAQGSIAKSAHGKGKTALIDLTADQGRIEDILGLFVQAPRSPMSGEVTLRAKVQIPSGPQPFLRKLSLQGNFGIEHGGFSNSSTQESVNKLSSQARGQKAGGEKDTSDPETVLMGLTGKVTVNNGVSTFSDISFGIPGAAALMHGTYNLINYKIDLRGQMKVDTKISKTTTGPKALLLKVMDPFFKKRRRKEIVPIRISGTYQKPSFGLDLNDKQAQTIDPPSHHHVREGLHGPQR